MATLGRRRERERSALAAERRARTPNQESAETVEGGGRAHSRGGATPVLFGRRASAPEEIRAAIVRVYAEHNPERLNGVDRLMAQHAGAESELLAKIVAKYSGGTARGQHAKLERRGSRTTNGSGRGARVQQLHRLQATRADQGSAPHALTQPILSLPPVAALPLELLRCCLRWLVDGVELGRCACVCRVWRTAAQDDGLWKPLYLATWPPPAEGAQASDHELITTPRRVPGPWRHSFRVRWVRQCEGRLRAYLSRMDRVGKLKPRRDADNCYDPAPNFGSLRKIVGGLGLSFFVRVNGGTWHEARQLTNSGGRRSELRDEIRGLSCSLRCPAAALVGVDTIGNLLSLEIVAKSSLLGRRFVVCTARCRRDPTALESRRGILPAASPLWRLVFDDAVKLYELPMGGCARDKCASFRPGGVSSSGGGASAITVVAFEEIGSTESCQLAPLGGPSPGPASAIQSAEGVGAVYCHVSHVDVVEQLLGLTATRLDPGVLLSPTSRGDCGNSSLGGAASADQRLGGRLGSFSNSLGDFNGGNAATVWGHTPRVDDLDSRFGLHDYAVGVTLRSFGKTLWEEFFQAVDANEAPPSGAAGNQQPSRLHASQVEDSISLVLVSREQAMGAGWDSLGRSGRSMDAPCLLWRSEGGLSGASAGCVLAEIAVWDDAGELICARTQAVHLAPVAEKSQNTEKAAALRTTYSELTTFQLKKMCREQHLNPAGTDATLIDRLVGQACLPTSSAQDPCLADGHGSRSDRRNGGAGSSGHGSLDFDTACAEERVLRGTGSDHDGDVTLSIEVLLEEGGGIIGGKGGGGGSEVIDLRLSLSSKLMGEWWGDGWSSAGRQLAPQQANAVHSAAEDALQPNHGGASSRCNSLGRDDAPEWKNDFTESHKPTAIGLSENDMLSMRVSQLRDLCDLARVPKSKLDNCLDSSDPKQAYIALLMGVRGFGDHGQSAQRLLPPTQRGFLGSSMNDDDVARSGSQHEQYTQHEQEPEPFDEWEPPAGRDPKDIGGGWSNDW
jgi:hypothetical protein